MDAMELRNLLMDDNAVSPVIGVILMVAITVILAAVIGTFVLGLGDQVQDTTPQASINFDFGATTVSIVHDGGDALEETQISVAETDSVTNTLTMTTDDGAYTAGDEIASGTFDSGETISVVWTSSDGSSSSTLGKSEAP